MGEKALWQSHHGGILVAKKIKMQYNFPQPFRMQWLLKLEGFMVFLIFVKNNLYEHTGRKS